MQAMYEDDLLQAGALYVRIDNAMRLPFFTGLAGGDPSKVAGVRSMRWYDALDARIYQLNQIRTK